MSITHYLSILFSRQRWRHALLAALLSHLLLGAYALIHDVFQGLNLSLLINGVQFALVQSALMLLYHNTSKQESQRYSLDTRFYIEQYKAERNRLLAFQRFPGEPLLARVGLPVEALTANGVKRLGSRHDLMVSQSVLEWRPTEPLSISHIRFELMNEWYELPWIVAEHGLDTILKRFNAVDRYDYNGLTLATHDRQVDEKGLKLRFKKSFYYNYLATNMLPEMQLPGGLTYRELLEPGPRLSDLETALPENHLGLSCLLRTQDGALIIPRRSQHTNVFKGQLSPSVTGAANMDTCRDPSGGYSPQAWLAQELAEELPFLARAPEAFPEPFSETLEHTEFLGMTRELRRCGKPELFFFLPLPLKAREVKALWTRHQGAETQDVAITDLKGIDHHENAGLLVVDEKELFERIRTHVITQPRSWHRKQRTDFHVVLPHRDQADILSESLVVNLILYRLSRQGETLCPA